MKAIYIAGISIVCIFAIGIGIVVGLETLRAIDSEDKEVQPQVEPQPEESHEILEPIPQIQSSLPEGCHGYAACFTGPVTRVIDGDTIEVNDVSVRFALVDTPERGEPGFEQARSYVLDICPPGSKVLVDQDDLQTGGSYGRVIGLVFCEGNKAALNEAVLEVGLAELSEFFCDKSEFAAHDWAIKFGC